MSDNLLYDSVHMLAYRDCFTKTNGVCPTLNYISSILTKWLNEHLGFIDAFDYEIVNPTVPIVSVSDICSPKNARFFKILAENGHRVKRTIDGDVIFEDLIATEDLH